MRSVGIRELKAHTSEIVEAVYATGERVQITRRGRPVAVLLSAPEALPGHGPETVQHDLAVWAEMDDLAEEIGRRWPKGVSAVDALAADRR